MPDNNLSFIKGLLVPPHNDGGVAVSVVVDVYWVFPESESVQRFNHFPPPSPPPPPT